MIDIAGGYRETVRKEKDNIWTLYCLVLTHINLLQGGESNAVIIYDVAGDSWTDTVSHYTLVLDFGPELISTGHQRELGNAGFCLIRSSAYRNYSFLVQVIN